MAFEIQDALIPTSIGRIDHFLDDLDGQTDNMSLQYNLEILDQFGDVMKMRSGDEAPFLTEQQIAQLKLFMANRRYALPLNLDFDPLTIVGRCTWRFRDGDGTAGSRSLHAQVLELDGQGQLVKRYRFNDQPNLTSEQIEGALAFLDAQRTKAVAEILP